MSLKIPKVRQLQSLCAVAPALRVDGEQLLQKQNQIISSSRENVRQRCSRLRFENNKVWQLCQSLRRVKHNFFLLRPENKIETYSPAFFIWCAQCLKNLGKLIEIRITWQERHTEQQLCQDTAYCPHVDSNAIQPSSVK
jgi:hypothetical protein